MEMMDLVFDCSTSSRGFMITMVCSRGYIKLSGNNTVMAKFNLLVIVEHFSIQNQRRARSNSSGGVGSSSQQHKSGFRE